MKIKLLISLALAFAAYVGAMTCGTGNVSCQIDRDSVQVSADSTQLSDPLQGYIFDRNIDGWVVNSCPGLIYSYTDSCGSVEFMKRKRYGRFTGLKNPWGKDPRSYGVNGYFKLNGNSDNKQTSQPKDSIPWWIQN